MYFADGSKVKLNLSPSDTTSDLLDHERVKDKLTSSAAQLWFIDCRGNGQFLLSHLTKESNTSRAMELGELMHSHTLFLYLEMSPPSPLTDQLLDPKDCPAFYQPKAHKFFALNPSHVVSWVTYAHLTC